MAVVGLIAVLLLLEPDYGTLLVLSCAVMGVLLLAGAPFTHPISCFWLSTSARSGIWFFSVIQLDLPYRISRFWLKSLGLLAH